MWFDITRTVKNGMPVYPGDPETEVAIFADERQTGGACVSRLSMCAHAGTHMDAPAHYIEGGEYADQIDLNRLIGPAFVQTDCGKYPAWERLLLKDFRAMDGAVAEGLPREVRLLGVDALTVGDDEAHRVLLRRGVILIEGLDLSAVADGEWELVCLPMRVSADGAPVRAAVRRLREG